MDKSIGKVQLPTKSVAGVMWAAKLKTKLFCSVKKFSCTLNLFLHYLPFQIASIFDWNLVHFLGHFSSRLSFALLFVALNTKWKNRFALAFSR